MMLHCRCRLHNVAGTYGIQGNKKTANINVKNEVYKNDYRRRSCISKTAKIHCFIRFVMYCIITTCAVECYWHCSDETVHYKSDETVNFFVVLDCNYVACNRFYKLLFFTRCMVCRRGREFCLSVRLSNACIVTKRNKNLFRFLYRTKDRLV